MMQRLSIELGWLTVVSRTLWNFLRKQARKSRRGATVNVTSPGLTHRIPKVLKQILPRSSWSWSANISRRDALSTRYLTKIPWRWATRACRTSVTLSVAWARGSCLLLSTTNHATAELNLHVHWMVTVRYNVLCTKPKLKPTERTAKLIQVCQNRRSRWDLRITRHPWSIENTRTVLNCRSVSGSS